LTANSFTRLEIVILDRVGLVEFRVALVFRLGLGHKILCTRTLHHLVPVQDRNVATHFCFDVGDIVDGGLWDLVRHRLDLGGLHASFWFFPAFFADFKADIASNYKED